MLTRGKMSEITELRELLTKRFDDLSSELEKKASNEKIDELLSKLEEKEQKIDELESRIKVLEQSNELLGRKIDDNESYGRRQNLRITGIKQPIDGSKESEDECLQKVKIEIEKLGVTVHSHMLDRAHRVGRIKNAQDGTVHNRPMIVRFTSWKDRTTVYRSRVKGGDVRFYIDLTQRRFKLRNWANERVKGDGRVNYIFADVNNNICIRLVNGSFQIFNSEYELEKILDNLK